jgi:hypothetical protein
MIVRLVFTVSSLLLQVSAKLRQEKIHAKKIGVVQRLHRCTTPIFFAWKKQQDGPMLLFPYKLKNVRFKNSDHS